MLQCCGAVLQCCCEYLFSAYANIVRPVTMYVSQHEGARVYQLYQIDRAPGRTYKSEPPDFPPITGIGSTGPTRLIRDAGREVVETAEACSGASLRYGVVVWLQVVHRPAVTLLEYSAVGRKGSL